MHGAKGFTDPGEASGLSEAQKMRAMLAYEQRDRAGVLRSRIVRYLRALIDGKPRFGRFVASGEPGAQKAGRMVALSAPPYDAACAEEGEVWFAETDLLAPVVPGKILCVGRNYAAHAKELGNAVPAEPLLFLKPSSSVIGHMGQIVLPPESLQVEHEAELAVVIGKRATRVSVTDALRYVFGYTCAGDITARDLQRKDVQFSRGKGFDTFCPLGPYIETETDPAALSIQCRVNGALRQNGLTSAMVFDVATLVSYMSHAMSLEPGDVLLTGTPEGVGPLVHGDTLEIEIAKIGTLRVSVAKLA
jgi:2-keto-4-pentenoate hydratase/2-oxohepta-3-ene-1,7-dioic acid hydratase in catechol pathway